MSANVLIQTAFLGDLLLSIPLIQRIKSLWPQQPLILVCRQGVGSFFRNTKLVDEVIEVKKGDSKSYELALHRLHEHSIDQVFSAHSSLRTAFFVKKIKAQKTIGFSKWWNGIFYDKRIEKDLRFPDAIRQLSLLKGFDPALAVLLEAYSRQSDLHRLSPEGQLPPPPAWASMSLRPFYEEQAEAVSATFAKLDVDLSTATKAVALFPGSVWATKRWTKEGFISLGQKLASEGYSILVMGGPGEEALCEEVSTQISGARNICGKTSIFESALVLSRLAAVVGNDSASLHLAATAETPSVVVFGPTVLEFGFRPWQKNVFVSEIKDLPCRPCGKHGHQKCPLGHHHCMKQISSEDVRAKLSSILR